MYMYIDTFEKQNVVEWIYESVLFGILRNNLHFCNVTNSVHEMILQNL
jgi:hypothetical protein